MIDFGIYTAYVLIALGVLGILTFAIARLITHPEAAKSVLIGIVGLAVLGIISYAISEGGETTGVYAKYDISEGTSRMVGAGLITFYLLMALAVLSIIYVEITRLFNKNG